MLKLSKINKTDHKNSWKKEIDFTMELCYIDKKEVSKTDAVTRRRRFKRRLNMFQIVLGSAVYWRAMKTVKELHKR